MHVVVPATNLRREVVDALNETGHGYRIVDVSSTDRAYYDLLSGLWADGESFCVVEHDIVIHDTALAELENCPGDWCGFAHRYIDDVGYGMGCVKFSAALIARNPDALARVGVMFDARHPKKHWCRLDAWLQGAVLPFAGEERCGHSRIVTHLGHGSAHGCL